MFLKFAPRNDWVLLELIMVTTLLIVNAVVISYQRFWEDCVGGFVIGSHFVVQSDKS